MITYAEMGFSANPQKYIIKIEKAANKSTWKFNRKIDAEAQVFPVEVSFQFVKVEQSEVDESKFKKAQGWQFSADLFYPFVKYNSASVVKSIAGILLMLQLIY